MEKDKQETANGLPEIGVGLDELVRGGARQVIQQAIEAELAQLLEQYANVKTLSGRWPSKCPRYATVVAWESSSIRRLYRPTCASHPACLRRCRGCTSKASRRVT